MERTSHHLAESDCLLGLSWWCGCGCWWCGSPRLLPGGGALPASVDVSDVSDAHDVSDATVDFIVAALGRRFYRQNALTRTAATQVIPSQHSPLTCHAIPARRVPPRPLRAWPLPASAPY
jgi:hypothetical protein